MNQKYRIIYADPPWSYIDKRGGIKYPVMDKRDIIDLGKSLAPYLDKNCLLFMWATFPNLIEALNTIKGWGFSYKTLGFSWIKTTRLSGVPFFGLGNYTRSNCEVCLIGVRGVAHVLSHSVSSVVISPISRHSKKPAEVRDKIVELCGDLPRIELFAREKVDGWDCWGNEVDSDICL